MFEYIIYIIIGIVCGLCLGITGINPISLSLLILNSLDIGQFKSNLGSILFLNLFPISLGSVYEFYNANLINYPFAFTLVITMMISSYLGSKFVTDKKNEISKKTIKYIIATISIIIGCSYLYSAYYEK
jgi:uncharacterized membrane protein YfcA